MEGPLPFFYYDILSRIVPGAVTLSVLWQVRGFRPLEWLKTFVQLNDKDSWQKLVVPFLLAGLCYVIGVVFEVVDYIWDVDVPQNGKLFRKWLKLVLNPMMELSVFFDDRAFFNAVDKRGGAEDRKECGDWKNREKIQKRREVLWERLTYLGSSDEKMKLVFAHCHRFQSEQKMFLHLTYSAFLFILLWSVQFRSYYPDPFPSQDIVASLFAILVFGICCRSRCRRRWLQVVTFSNLIESEKEDQN